MRQLIGLSSLWPRFLAYPKVLFFFFILFHFMNFVLRQEQGLAVENDDTVKGISGFFDLPTSRSTNVDFR